MLTDFQKWVKDKYNNLPYLFTYELAFSGIAEFKKKFPDSDELYLFTERVENNCIDASDIAKDLMYQRTANIENSRKLIKAEYLEFIKETLEEVEDIEYLESQKEPEDTRNDLRSVYKSLERMHEGDL